MNPNRSGIHIYGRRQNGSTASMMRRVAGYRHHTTGHETMKPLDKILYIADKTEPDGRSLANAELLTLAKTDLEEAFYRVMEASVGYLREKGQLVHRYREAVHTLQKERQFDGKNNLILKTLHDKLGVDIITIEFTDSTVADTFIATGNVPSHTQAMADGWNRL